MFETIQEILGIVGAAVTYIKEIQFMKYLIFFILSLVSLSYIPLFILFEKLVFDLVVNNNAFDVGT